MRWSVLAGSVFACLVGCAGAARPSVKLYESGDYAGAANAADQGLAAHPDDEGLWQMRVRSALAIGDAAGVAKAYASYREHLHDDDRDLVRELAIATLGQALEAPAIKLKLAAIDAVVAAELEPLADPVARRMTDDDDRVVAAASIAVLRGDPRAAGNAGEMLHSESAEARRIVVDGIGKKVGALALADLEKAANDPDARVRQTAIRWLGQLRDKDAVAILTMRIHDGDEAVRAASASALAKIGLGNLGALGGQAIQDPALAVRLAGIELLVATHGLGTAQLTKLVDDPDPVVATEAAIALGGGDRAAAAIGRAAAADAWELRAGAANLATRALGKSGAAALAHSLIKDSEPRVRLAAARALAHDGLAGDDKAAAEIYAELMNSDNGALFVEAATAAAEQGTPAGLAALDKAVRELAQPADRVAAAAGHASAHRITPGLVAALADPNGLVRVAAAAALALLTKN